MSRIQVNVRLTQEDDDLVREAAELEHMSLSDWIRAALTERAVRTIDIAAAVREGD